MKLCKDCAFCVPGTIWLRCSNPKVPPRDLSTGELPIADHVRVRYRALCGKEAKLFEPRPPEPPAPPHISWWTRNVTWPLWQWLRA